MPFDTSDVRSVRTAWQRFAEQTPLPHDLDQSTAYWLFCQGALAGVGVMALHLADVADMPRENLEEFVEAVGEIPVIMNKVGTEVIAESQRAAETMRRGG